MAAADPNLTTAPHQQHATKKWIGDITRATLIACDPAHSKSDAQKRRSRPEALEFFDQFLVNSDERAPRVRPDRRQPVKEIQWVRVINPRWHLAALISGC